MDHEKRQEHASFSNTSDTTPSTMNWALRWGHCILTMAIAISPWFLLLWNPAINETALIILVIGAWLLASWIALVGLGALNKK